MASIALDKTLTSHWQNVPPWAFARTKSVDLTPSFNLHSLAPGEYVLTLDVTFDRRVTTRYVRFTVTPQGRDEARVEFPGFRGERVAVSAHALPRTEVGYERFLNVQMASPDARILVTDLTGPDGSTQVVGYVYAAVEPESFKELRARAGYIHDLLVSDDAQKTGVGSRLIEAAVTWLREQHVPRVLLWPAAPNERARRLFEAHGFAATMVEMTREL